MASFEIAGRLEKIKNNLKVSESEDILKAQEFLNTFFWQLSMSDFDVITGERYSCNFIVGLFNLYVQGIEIGHIVEELKHLEDPKNNISRTKPATQFKKLPLKGLWHKHFLPGDISSISTNILNAINAKGGLKKVINDVCLESGKGVSTEELVQTLVEEVVEIPFAERSEQGLITGEWIVYHQFDGKNYYLAIATHKGGIDENGNTGDEVLAKTIKSFSNVEFPKFKDSLEIFSE
ncbi:hypothetical protein ACUM6W_02430 [Acinetobacter tandoii]|uniref:hypothetical protein n=1 Tax=Acinetobacter tandoii TaxID=202954 RepID=UPI0040467658